MSKVKSPQQKKALSLKKDRRNIFGECPKSSRKNIRLGKQLSHRRERHVVDDVLGRMKNHREEDDILEMEALARSRSIEKHRRAFKKTPDAPLGQVISRKQTRREMRGRGCHRHFAPERAFDTPYVAKLHQQAIKASLRNRFRRNRWEKKGKAKRFTGYDRRAALAWRDAILGNAALLKGFFAEEPDWREKMLSWCEKALK